MQAMSLVSNLPKSVFMLMTNLKSILLLVSASEDMALLLILRYAPESSHGAFPMRFRVELMPIL